MKSQTAPLTEDGSTGLGKAVVEAQGARAYHRKRPIWANPYVAEPARWWTAGWNAAKGGQAFRVQGIPEVRIMTTAGRAKRGRWTSRKLMGIAWESQGLGRPPE